MAGWLLCTGHVHWATTVETPIHGRVSRETAGPADKGHEEQPRVYGECMHAVMGCVSAVVD